jgi:AhpD family alkylhydroperoxidase
MHTHRSWEVAVLERMKHRFGDRVERRIVAAGIARVKYVRPVRPEEASGLVAAVYDKLAHDFQLLAPLTLTSGVPSLLAACWMVVRETLVSGAVPRIEKEMVAEGVSKANECPYCVAAHALMLKGGSEDEIAGALARGDVESIPTPGFGRLPTGPSIRGRPTIPRWPRLRSAPRPRRRSWVPPSRFTRSTGWWTCSSDSPRSRCRAASGGRLVCSRSPSRPPSRGA